MWAFAPHPTPLPVKNGERERTEIAIALDHMRLRWGKPEFGCEERGEGAQPSSQHVHDCTRAISAASSGCGAILIAVPTS
jgi:hypothetical protein